MSGTITIIGGGAAGMTAAVAAAREGASVTLLEAGSTPGKKILSTGNGRCNLTNRKMDASCFRSRSPETVSQILSQFGLEDTLLFFRSLGLYFSDRGGYIYPRSEQAASVRTALESAVRRSGVDIQTGQKVVSARWDHGYHLETASGKRIHTGIVILAAGGSAAPKTGSDGSGFRLAHDLGHSLVPPVPALVPLHLQNTGLCRLWKGVRVKGTISLLTDGREADSDTGELQLTESGISGIPVFQVSRYAAYGLLEGKQVSAVLDFLPEFSPEDRKGIFAEFSQSRRGIAEALEGLIPPRLAQTICRTLGVKDSMPCYALKGKEKRQLAVLLTSWELPVTATGNLEAAQVTAGGADLRDLHPDTMESRICPGLYMAGELLDADGICGGYNLQWAWSTGAIAGRSAGRRAAK